VPTPPRGYWAKKEAGKFTRQILLFDIADPQDELLVIRRSPELPEPIRKTLTEARTAPRSTTSNEREYLKNTSDTTHDSATILEELMGISTKAGQLRTWIIELQSLPDSAPCELARFGDWARARLKRF
jgi:hypothetical protein